MPFTLVTDVADIEPGTHARKVFDKYFPQPEQQALLQELWNHADPMDLTMPLPISVVDVCDVDDNGNIVNIPKGFGGRGRVTIIGDAAHSMRPASGLGGALAFEDAVVLYRRLKEKNKIINRLDTRDAAHELVTAFEGERIERVAKIWKSEYDIAENAYKRAPRGMTDEFRKWIYDGV